MKSRIAGIIAPVAVVLLVLGTSTARSQSKLMADGKLGLSIFSGGGSSTGLLIGGAVDIPIQPKLFIRPELNITTHAGTPIEIAGEAKYMLDVKSKNPYYIAGGLGLWFYSGGSSLGLDFTGGTIFSISGSQLLIPAEFRIGPIFASGNTIFQVTLSSGIRFSLQ